jgi:FkbM family methyltransferase
MHQLLLTNIHANGAKNITVEQAGLWSQDEIRPFYQPRGDFENGSTHDGLGTLFPGKRRAASGLRVQLTTFDQRREALGLESVDVIKLDVEGAELHVLKGAERTIAHYRPTILLEVDRTCAAAAGTSAAEVLHYLSRWYRFELVTSTGRTRKLNRRRLREHQDLLCLPL